MVSDISSDMVTLLLSFLTVLLEVNNQLSTNILTAVNGASGVACDNMIYC